jgi:AhpD family alkylhydroperoxidase
MYLDKEHEDLYYKFSDKVYESGVFDMKTKELFAFSNAIMIDCKGCMRSHYKKAIAEGATDEEIAVVIALCMTVAAGKRKGIVENIIAEVKKE